MRYGSISWVLAGACFFQISYVHAAPISLDRQARNLLTSLGRVPYTHDRHVRLRSGCSIFQSCDEIRRVTDHSFLTASNTRVVSEGDAEFGQRTETELKANTTVLDQSQKNCVGSGKGSMTLAISVQVTNTVTTTLTNQYALATAGSFGFSGGVFGFATLSGSVTITGTRTRITTKSVALAGTNTRTATDSHDVDPNTLMTGSLTLYPIKTTIPFSIPATFDADVSPNDKGWHRLSDIYPPEKRSFVLKGTLTVTQASTGDVEFSARSLSPAECAGHAVSARIGSAGPVLLKRRGVLDLR